MHLQRSLLLVLAAAVDPDFAAWYDRFDRTYEGEEKERREAIFLQNLAFIREHNRGGHTYELGLNQFSDLSSEEFRSTHLGYKPGPVGPSLGVHSATAESLPPAVDWREKGAVSSVKDQGSCGSCWAFGTAGAIEGAWQIASGKLTTISVQQFVDCDRLPIHHGCAGCLGGQPSYAYEYAETAKMCTWDSYPYVKKFFQFGSCKADSCNATAMPKGAVAGYKTVNTSEADLQSAVAQQPVTFIIEADKDVFQHYKSGVLTGDGCGDKLDHAVLGVGYGTDGGHDYWWVKNSWGPSWGEKGYIRMLRGVNQCGLLNGPPLYPVIKKPSADSVADPSILV